MIDASTKPNHFAGTQKVRIRRVDPKGRTDQEVVLSIILSYFHDGGNSMYSSRRPSSGSYVKLEATEPWCFESNRKGFWVHCPMTDSDFDIIYDAFMARRENADLVELLFRYHHIKKRRKLATMMSKFLTVWAHLLGPPALTSRF